MKYESLIEKLKTENNDSSSEAIEAIQNLNEEIENLAKSKYQVIEEKRNASKKASGLETALNSILSEFDDLEGETTNDKINNLYMAIKKTKNQLESAVKEKETINNELSSLKKAQTVREIADSMSANYKVLEALTRDMIIEKDGDSYKLGRLNQKEPLKTIDELLASNWEHFKPSLFPDNTINIRVPSAPPKSGTIDPFENLAKEIINKKYPEKRTNA